MVNIALVTKTRSCIPSSTFLGYEGENEANKLVFSFQDEFIDGSAQLNIKRGNDNGYVALVKAGETYELEVKSSLVSQIGDVTFQLQVSKSDGTIYKYDAFVMTVKDAIDSDAPLPEDYPTWQEAIATALAQVENIDIFATKVDNVATVSVTDKNGVITEVEIHDGEDGADGISSEIAVKTNTDTEYVLTVKDKNGSFDTPNLKGKDAEGGGIESETDPLYSADKPNIALKTEIPTKTSQLANDNMFATESFVTNKIAEAELSGGDVDLSGYATKDELNKKANVEDIPTKVSELTNDAGYIKGYTETDPTVPAHVKAITEANITNWNNKQDVLTAGNNITIENGVISASGSGEGGLAELPIATSDTLGGIKVGEGLEITEDGILSALGGGTGGVAGEIATLYKGEFATASSSLALSDNINNYDLVVVNTYIKGAAGHKQKASRTIVVDQIAYSGNEEYNVITSALATSLQYAYVIRFGFDSSGDKLITGIISKSSDYSANDVGIDSVYGIKLGSGTGGSVGSMVEIGDCALESSTTNLSGEKSVTLSKSIENFDLIVVERYGSNSANTVRFQVEPIIFTTDSIINAPANATTKAYQSSNGYNTTDAKTEIVTTFKFPSNDTLLITVLHKNGTAYDKVGLGKVYGIKFGSGGSSEIAYSTEETKIGTWVDGKPIYRKVITGYKTRTTSTDGTQVINPIDVSSLNVDSVVNLSGTMTSSVGLSMVMPVFRPGSSYGALLFFEKSSNTVNISNFCSNFGDRDVVIIFEYTKTTD